MSPPRLPRRACIPSDRHDPSRMTRRPRTHRAHRPGAFHRDHSPYVTPSASEKLWAISGSRQEYGCATRWRPNRHVHAHRARAAHARGARAIASCSSGQPHGRRFARSPARERALSLSRHREGTPRCGSARLANADTHTTWQPNKRGAHAGIVEVCGAERAQECRPTRYLVPKYGQRVVLKRRGCLCAITTPTSQEDRRGNSHDARARGDSSLPPTERCAQRREK